MTTSSMGSCADRHDYREIAPSEALRDLVECFWSRSLPAQPGRAPHRVLPDGCADILFDLEAERAFVVGTMTRPLIVAADRASRFLAVRFRPGAAAAFLPVPMHELTDGELDLRDVWCDADEAHDRAHEGVAALDRLLCSRLAHAPPIPRLVRGAVQSIAADPSATSIAMLSDHLGITRQHLARSFARWVGVGPKMLARVMRMQRAVRGLRQGGQSLAAFALDLGYTDQAHLTSELRALTGVTPKGWAGSILPRTGSAAER